MVAKPAVRPDRNARPDTDGPPPHTPRPMVQADAAAHPPSASPARDMQVELSAAFGDVLAQADAARWSARRTLALLVLSCGAFWMAAAAGLVTLIG